MSLALKLSSLAGLGALPPPFWEDTMGALDQRSLWTLLSRPDLTSGGLSREQWGRGACFECTTRGRHRRGAPARPGMTLLLAGSPSCPAGLHDPQDKLLLLVPGPAPVIRPPTLACFRSGSATGHGRVRGERREAPRSSPCPALPGQQAASET